MTATVPIGHVVVGRFARHARWPTAPPPSTLAALAGGPTPNRHSLLRTLRARSADCDRVAVIGSRRRAKLSLRARIRRAVSKARSRVRGARRRDAQPGAAPVAAASARRASCLTCAARSSVRDRARVNADRHARRGRRGNPIRRSSSTSIAPQRHPSVLLDALVARAPELQRRERRPPPLRGSGAASRARDGRALPPPRAVHRPERARRGQRGPGRLRARLPVRRAAPVRVAGCCPLDAVFMNVSPPDAHGFCSLGTSVDAMHAAIRAARDGHRPAQSRDAADARRQLHPRRRHRPRRRGGRAAVRAPARRRSATSSGGSASYVADLVPDGATLQMGIGAIPAAVGAALTDKRDLGVHTEMFTDAVRRPGRGGRRHRRPQGESTAARS